MSAGIYSDAKKLTLKGVIATAIAVLLPALPAFGQDSAIYVQCPDMDDTDPTVDCIHLVGGDGMVRMADGRDMYIFSFAELPLPGSPDVPGYPAAPGDLSYADWTMDEGILAANAPAPTITLDEDDELYLTLTNVGMAVRPDLFDAHTVHWHGFPEASSVFDGVPDASISINMGASLTYYYQANDAGTYMYHCHVEATEHMQMGMLGNLWVRPRQNRCPIADGEPGAGLPGSTCPDGHTDGDQYAYNDGDGSTRYDVEKEIQLGSFDSNFHDASFNVQPLPFAGMRDDYFLINGRGYPDTVNEGVIETADPLDGSMRPSQPVHSLVSAPPNSRVLLRISNLNVTQFNTLGTNGPPMQVIARDARLLRDDDDNNMYYFTNSLTLGGGQSYDVIIDTTGLASGSKFFLYSTNLDYLANGSENLGGMMTEIRIN